MSTQDELHLLSQDAQEILKARFERVQLKSSREEHESVLEIAEFQTGGDSYAIPLNALRKAMPLRRVTPVPRSANHVVGIMRFEGQVLCVLSLGSLLGFRGWTHDPTVVLVIERRTGWLTAIDCEEIPKASTLPAQAVAEARARSTGGVADVTTSDVRQVRLIDLDALVEMHRIEGERAAP